MSGYDADLEARARETELQDAVNSLARALAARVAVAVVLEPIAKVEAGQLLEVLAALRRARRSRLAEVAG